MKKAIICIIPLMMAACAPRERQAEIRFAEIYDSLCQYYNTEQAEPSLHIDTLYCTTSLAETVGSALRWEENCGDIAIDADPWLGAQDYANVEYAIDSVDMTDDSTATVHFKICNMGWWSEARTIMRRERGDWYVDDLQHLNDYGWYSFRESIAIR